MKKMESGNWGKLYAVMAAVCMLSMLWGTAAKAAETATQACTPTENDRAFVLSRIETDKSSRQQTKHWVKIFTTTEPKKRMYDIASIPDATKKISVTFEISNYDLDKTYGAYWGYQMSGDDGSGGKWLTTSPSAEDVVYPYTLEIKGDGTYTMEFDAEAIIGSTVSSRGMQQLQIVIILADDEAAAAEKQTAIEVKEVLCEYTKAESDTGNAGTGDAGTGSTGTGDTGTGSTGSTGTGGAGTGSTGNTGTGGEGTGSTGTGDIGTGDGGTGDTGTEDGTNKKEAIKTLKLTSCKKGSKKVSGKTIKKADVTVKIIYGPGTSETYTVKSDKKGKFSVKTLMTLEKNTKIKVTVKKKGYKTKKKTYKVK